MCINIHKEGGGTATLKMVEKSTGLSLPDKVWQCRSLGKSKHRSVTGWKFHNFPLYTIDTNIANTSGTSM